MNKNGFTLLEIMVAIGIMAISLVALLGYQGQTLIVSGRAERITVSTLLARQKMVDVQIELEKGLAKGEFPDEKEESGDFEEPFDFYKWRYKIKSVDFPTPTLGKEGSMQNTVAEQLTKEISQSLRELKVTVYWIDQGEEQSLDLVTHWIKL